MTDPRGFLQLQRRVAPYRPVDERRADWRDVNGTPDEGLVREQARRCMDCGVPFCHTGCPLGNLIPDWNDLVERGRWREALRAARRHEQLPRVHRQALPGAVRGGVRAGAERRPGHDQAGRDGDRRPRRSTRAGSCRGRPPPRAGGSVAVVGSGPAGLAAAQQLRRAGHARDGVRARRPPGRPAALRHPRLQAREDAWSTGASSSWRPRASCSGAARPIADLADAALATTTRSCWPPARSGTATSTLPGRELAGIELAMPYLIACNRRGAGLDAGPIVADRAARGDPRRRRHQRRLPRLGAPRGLRVGGRDRARRRAADRARRRCRPGRAGRGCVARTPRTSRAATAATPSRRSSSSGRDGRVTGAPRCGRRRDRGRPRADRRRVHRRRGRPRRRRSRRARRWPSTTAFATSVAGRVRGRRLRARRRPDRDRDRRRPRVRARGRPLPDGLDDVGLPRSPDPRTLHGWLNSSPQQTPSGTAVSPTDPASSRSRAARPVRSPSPGPAAPKRPTARPAPRS